MPAALQIWSHTFCREYDRLPMEIQSAIRNKVDEMGLRLESYPHQRLTGRLECRLRVGDYRVLYEMDVSQGRIFLLYVGHRRAIYKSA